MMPNGMRPAIPPEPNINKKGKQPNLLTDDEVNIILPNPNEW